MHETRPGRLGLCPVSDQMSHTGNTRLITLRLSKQALIWVTVLLYNLKKKVLRPNSFQKDPSHTCSRYRMPPRKNPIPRIRGRFARMEPRSDA